MTAEQWAHLRGIFFDNWQVPMAIVSVIASLGVVSSVYFYVRIANETGERRNQICVVDERDQRQDVERLERTYAFLDGLPARERDSSLVRAVITGLPDTERDAREDDAPPFCDQPGVGRPEPDPKVTTRRPVWLPKLDPSQHGQSKYQQSP